MNNWSRSISSAFRMYCEVKQRDWTIRNMETTDLDQVMVIENDSFVSPWSYHSFVQELDKQDSFTWVAVFREMVIGYIIGWYMIDEIHIGNLAVKRSWRTKGIAKGLIQHCLENRGSFSTAILEVRRSNIVAQTLYQKMGFHVAGIQSNYYQKESEDAIIMVKHLVSQVNQMED